MTYSARETSTRSNRSALTPGTLRRVRPLLPEPDVFMSLTTVEFFERFCAVIVCIFEFLGENCIVVTLSANSELNAERARAVENGIAAASLVMCQSEVDQAGNIEAFKLAKKHNGLS